MTHVSGIQLEMKMVKFTFLSPYSASFAFVQWEICTIASVWESIWKC